MRKAGPADLEDCCAIRLRGFTSKEQVQLLPPSELRGSFFQSISPGAVSRQAFISSHLNYSSSLPPGLPPAAPAPLLHPPQLGRPTSSSSAPVICCARDHAHGVPAFLRLPAPLTAHSPTREPVRCGRQDLCPREPGLWPPREVLEASEGREAAGGTRGMNSTKAPSSRPPKVDEVNRGGCCLCQRDQRPGPTLPHLHGNQRARPK